MEFLIQDANVTRKAFMRWWIEDYLKSSHGKALPKAVKTEIKGLIEARPPNPTSRESLLPGTVSVIKTWESIPLVPGSVEWAKARVRLIRDVIFDGRFKEYQDHFDLDATPGRNCPRTLLDVPARRWAIGSLPVIGATVVLQEY